MKDISIYQWDSDLSLDSDSPVLFCAKGDKDGLVVASNGGKVSIPNQLTAKGKDIAAYALDDAHVLDSCWIRVTALAKPSNYVYTETEIDSVESFKDFAVAAIKAAQDEYNGVADAAQAALAEIQKQVKVIESAEDSRIESEEQRAAAEAKRESSYISWSEEETKRQNQEAAREAAEAERESDTKAAIQNISDAIDTANLKVDSSVKAANTKVDSAIDTANSKVDTLISESKAKVDTQVSLAKDATDNANASAAKADTATSNADEAAIAANNAAQKANEVEAKLTGNILKGTAKDTFIHVDDAFPSSLLGIEIEGATEQVTTTGKNLVNLKEAKSTDKGLSLDVKARGQIIINGTSTGGLWTKIGTVDVVEGKNYVLSINKAYPNFGISAWSNSDKKHVLFVEKNNQAAKAVATKTETLSIFAVGGENTTFTTEVVSIQIEEGTSKTDWEPYTGGKPSPSPDYPQEIKVLENPQLYIAGRNLADISRAKYSATYTGSDYVERISNGIRINITSNANRIVTIPFNGKRGCKYYVSYNCKKNTGDRDFLSFYLPQTQQCFGKRAKFICEKNVSYCGIYLDSDLTGSYDVTDFIIKQADDESAYSDFVSIENQTINLPSEHPYLAKLPDGTADEIKVDRDGNVTLIARVGRVSNASMGSCDSAGELDNTNGHSIYGSIYGETEFNFNSNVSPKKCGAAYCDKLYSAQSPYVKITDAIYKPNSSTFVINMKGATTNQEASDMFAALKSTIYLPCAEQSFNIGKINLPNLPQTVSNLWVDSDLNPEIGITYVKDVNIAYDKLANAIVASGAVGGDN